MRLNEWETNRQELFTNLSSWCGKLPERGDLTPSEIWRREYATHTEIKRTYEGEPGERIPAYLLIPLGQ